MDVDGALEVSLDRIQVLLKRYRNLFPTLDPSFVQLKSMGNPGSKNGGTVPYKAIFFGHIPLHTPQKKALYMVGYIQWIGSCCMAIEVVLNIWSCAFRFRWHPVAKRLRLSPSVPAPPSVRHPVANLVVLLALRYHRGELVSDTLRCCLDDSGLWIVQSQLFGAKKKRFYLKSLSLWF